MQINADADNSNIESVYGSYWLTLIVHQVLFTSKSLTRNVCERQLGEAIIPKVDACGQPAPFIVCLPVTNKLRDQMARRLYSKSVNVVVPVFIFGHAYGGKAEEAPKISLGQPLVVVSVALARHLSINLAGRLVLCTRSYIPPPKNQPYF